MRRPSPTLGPLFSCLLGAALVTSGCTATTNPAPTVTPATVATDWSARAFDTRTHAETSVEAMLDALAAHDVVFVGETHIDAATHEMELRILEGLASRKKNALALSMEMFQRDVQPTVDAYLAGSVPEAEFLREARAWHNYRTGYRPMVEFAKSNGIPVIASNLPASVQRAFAFGGSKAKEKLSPEDAAWVSDPMLPPEQTYWDRVARRLRDAGHGAPAELDEEQRKWSVQNLWDNSMADAIVAAQMERGSVVHVVGAFHIEHGDGLPSQVRRRAAALQTATITLVPTSDLARARVEADDDRADYVVFVPARARGPQEGRYGVSVDSEVRYRLEAPAVVDEPRPLLIWFGSAGSSAGADARYLATLVGDQAFVAVVEPPYRGEQPDLRTAGRWAFADTHAQDLGRLVSSTESIASYVGARWPISNVVVAGEQAGADAALWFSLYGDIDGAKVVALSPQSAQQLAEASVAERAPDRPSVVLVGEGLDGGIQTLVLAGSNVRVHAPSENARAQLEGLLADALGTRRPDLSGDTVALRVAVDAPIARQWSRLAAARLEADGRPRIVAFGGAGPESPLTVGPQDFASGHALPLAPGPFGGTTMLVVPPQTDPTVLAAWKKLGDDDVIKARSRFARLVVTTQAELPTALDELAASGRRNVLIVPATFAATSAQMQQLAASAEGHTSALRVAWLPGLGGSWAASLGKPEEDESPKP